MASKPSSDNRAPDPSRSVNQEHSKPTPSGPLDRESVTDHKRTVVNRIVLLTLVAAVLFVLARKEKHAEVGHCRHHRLPAGPVGTGCPVRRFPIRR